LANRSFALSRLSRLILTAISRITLALQALPMHQLRRMLLGSVKPDVSRIRIREEFYCIVAPILNDSECLYYHSDARISACRSRAASRRYYARIACTRVCTVNMHAVILAIRCSMKRNASFSFLSRKYSSPSVCPSEIIYDGESFGSRRA